MRWMRWTALGVVLAIVSLAPVANGLPSCQQCSGPNSCSNGGFALTCTAGTIMGIPFCLQTGSCGGMGGGGGFDDLPIKRPRLQSQAVTPDAAPTPAVGVRSIADETRLELYAVGFPIRGGFDPFESRAVWWVERGVGEPRTPGAFLSAVARHSGMLAERLEVGEGWITLGPSQLRLGLGDFSGDGYVIDARACEGGVRMRLCAARSRQPVTALTEATLAPEDVLCVRVHINGLDMAMAFAARALREEDVELQGTAAAERQRFQQAVGPLTARATPYGRAPMPFEPAAGDCR